MSERSGAHWRPGPVTWALAAFAVVLIGLRIGGIDPPGWQVILLYAGIYSIVALVHSRLGARRGDAPDYSYLPTSGPVGRGGQALLIFTFSVSGMLSVLNPFLLWQQLRQLAGQLSISRRLKRGLPDADTHRSSISYRLPFAGVWFVYNGGVTPGTSHSWGILTQRYAYDFVVVDDAYARHTGSGTRLEDYHCYGRPILAAADGEVVEVRDGINDARFLGYGVLDILSRDFRGNFVVIRHAEGEYSFSAHLIPGSIHVAAGDRVRQGQPIGRCGHSGFSSEPHLHFHLQDGPDFFTAMGLPIRFDDVEVLEQRIDGGEYLTAGAKVRHAGD